MQFADNVEAVQIHEAANKEVEKQRAKLKAKLPKVSLELLVANLATDSIRDIAGEDPGAVFSMHAGSKLFTPAPCLRTCLYFSIPKSHVNQLGFKELHRLQLAFLVHMFFF